MLAAGLDVAAFASPPPLWGRDRAGVDVPDRLTLFARGLRKNATSAERNLWRAINAKQIEGFRFRRQVPLLGFIVDFICTEVRLVIEVDGATHSTDEEVMHDARRDAALRAEGNSVLRFRNEEIYENLDGVLETIRLKLLELRPINQSIPDA